MTANLTELSGSKSDTVIHLGAAVDKGNYEITPTTTADSAATLPTDARGTVLTFRSENRGLANVYRAQVAGDYWGTSPGYGASANNNANISKNLKGIELALSSGSLKFQTEYFINVYGVAGKACLVNTGTCVYPSFDLSAKSSYQEFV